MELISLSTVSASALVHCTPLSAGCGCGSRRMSRGRRRRIVRPVLLRDGRRLIKRFLDEAGGDPVRAEHLRKAHFARMALKSVQARRRKDTIALARASEAGLSAMDMAALGTVAKGDR